VTNYVRAHQPLGTEAEVDMEFSSVQFVTLLKQMFSEAVGLLEQVGFKPSPELSSTYQW